MGLQGNLRYYEILEQVVHADRILASEAAQRAQQQEMTKSSSRNNRVRLASELDVVRNVVFMGMGEPLDNYNNVLEACRGLLDRKRWNLAYGRVTVSTVGLPAKIKELAKLNRPFNLAVSLHAATDQLRDELVPVNDNIGVDAILAAADEYFEVTGRRITYEYVLLGGINDQPQHAHQLADLLTGRNAHVNLIPMNDVETLPFHEPAEPETENFVAILESRGTAATVRKRKGADIDAACGQLRLKKETASESDA